MKKHWILKNQADDAFRQSFPDVQPLVLQLLYDRGLKTQEAIDEFLNADYVEDIHSPFLFENAEAIVQKIFDSIEKKEKIIVYGDYDADGVTGSATLVSTLKYIGANVDVYIPHREKEGYGLNPKALEFLQNESVNLVITVDSGITNVEEVKKAKDMGVDVIITDHHHPPEILPDCLILHPKVDKKYPFKELAGAGVAFKLSQALLQSRANEDKENATKYKAFEKWLLDLVAIGTVGDLVPLVGENRTLVKYGLIVLNKTKRIGLKMLMENAGVKLDPEKDTANTWTIAFQVAPRINAAGRMDHASIAYELIMEENRVRAIDLANRLEMNNQERKNTTKAIYEQAIEQIESQDKDLPYIIAYNEHWNLGLVGLVAGKLTEKYNKPAFIMGKLGKLIAGSGRGIDEFNCMDAITSQSEKLEKFGGHKSACGFSIKNDVELKDFREGLGKEIAQQLEGKDLTPTIEIDAELTLNDIDWDTFEEIKKFEPFGQSNPRIVLVSYGVRLVQFDPVGRDNAHLRLSLSDPQSGKIRKAIAFGFGAWVNKLKVGEYIDVVYEIDVNEWNGNRELQLRVVDLRHAKKE